MGKLNRMKNQYVKGQMEKLSSGGDLVSDAEKTGFQTQATEQANQAIGVQQQGLNRSLETTGRHGRRGGSEGHRPDAATVSGLARETKG